MVAEVAVEPAVVRVAEPAAVTVVGMAAEMVAEVAVVTVVEMAAAVVVDVEPVAAAFKVTMKRHLPRKHQLLKFQPWKPLPLKFLLPRLLIRPRSYQVLASSRLALSDNSGPT